MATEDFRSVVEVFKSGAAGRGAVYFRPTHKGIVMLGLHDGAPKYVGFRRHRHDRGHCLAAHAAVPTVAAARGRWDAFEAWLPTVGGRSEEERGVIRWLRRALENQLSLPELGPGWVFLGHEWRFQRDDGGHARSDVLAVHLPTGRLGIVELKDDPAKPAEARMQVAAYGRHWARDGRELAPFFSDLLRGQGAAYGNVDAATGLVRLAPAELFVGVATTATLTIER